MLLKRIYDEKLAQASYLVGCQATGQALVIDPARDADRYIQAAGEEGLEIVAVTETHIHADFLSGARELAERTGARLYLSGEGPPPWKYEFPATLVRDGFELELGKLRLRVLATPGHTPEHIAFLLTDTAASDAPMGMFTGDFLFVGDVGRPDLLERAAGFRDTMEAGARQLYASLEKMRAYPDHLQIWPGHGAGSACGKGLGAVAESTLGFERSSNWALRAASEQDFVQAVLSGQPEPPTYFAIMKQLNKLGPPTLAQRRTPLLMPASKLKRLLEQGALVLDLRPAPAFAARMLPGLVNIPLSKVFPTWAGWLVPYDVDLFLVTDRMEEARRDLSSIGLDRVVGHFRPEAVEQLPGLTALPRAVPGQVELDGLRILDVRFPAEHAARHLPGALNIPLPQLATRVAELKGDGRPLAVYCQSGGRSAMAVSLLQRAGLTDTLDLGGITGWLTPVISAASPTR